MLYRKNLKKKLAPIRYKHSLSVSYACMDLAMHYDCDLSKAELAGLLYSCGGRYSDNIILKKCLKHGLGVTDAEYKALPVLHAKYRTWLAEHEYQVMDREILDTIGCHTAGRPKMTTSDKILYIADYMEPRCYKARNLSKIRRLAYEDLDETMYAILTGTLDYLKKGRGGINPLTTQAYEYFKVGGCETSLQF